MVNTNTLMRGGMEVTAQQDTVIHTLIERGIAVVSAGAGSGKTYTTVAAVLEILELGHATLDQFVLITFTRKAAHELAKRLEEAIAKRLKAETNPERKRFWRSQLECLSAAFVGTIHSFCWRLLRTFGYQERVAREAGLSFSQYLFTQVGQDVVEKYLVPEGVADGQIASVLNLPLFGGNLSWQEYELRDQVALIAAYLRNRGLSAKDLYAMTEAQPLSGGRAERLDMANLVLQAEELYSERKAEKQLLDQADLLLRTAQLLEGSGANRMCERLKERFRYLFIDEFQDTDEVQKRIVDALYPHLEGMLIVGDRKQSIYGFRSANVHLLPQIARENQTEVLPLNVSRRPTRQLLAVQNALFRSMGQRYKELDDMLQASPVLIDSKSDIKPLTFVWTGQENDIEQKIAATAAQLRSLIGSPFEDPKTGEMRPLGQGDIVLIMRSNYKIGLYAERLAELLQGSGIVVRPDQGGTFFRRPEIAATYRMLRLLLNYEDDAALDHACADAYLRGVDLSKPIGKILEKGPRPEAELIPWFKEHYPDYAEKIRKLRALVRTATVAELLAQLYELFDIQTFYRRNGNVQAADNLDKLREQARDLVEYEQGLTVRQFATWLETMILTGQDEEEAQSDPSVQTQVDYVRMMTVHRSKGLEFPVVIIPEVQALLIKPEPPPFLIGEEFGLELNLQKWGAQTCSSQYGKRLAQRQEEIVEEEMRIFYVAITRAQHAVVLVASGSPRPAGSIEYISWKSEVLRAWNNLPQQSIQRVGL